MTTIATSSARKAPIETDLTRGAVGGRTRDQQLCCGSTQFPAPSHCAHAMLPQGVPKGANAHRPLPSHPPITQSDAAQSVLAVCAGAASHLLALQIQHVPHSPSVEHPRHTPCVSQLKLEPHAVPEG